MMFRRGNLALSCLVLVLAVAVRSCAALKPPVVSATSTTTPPLIDVPTYSMATCCPAGSDTPATTNMNIVTYATPVSVRPERVWAIGIFKETLSYECFCSTRSCVLQLLSEQHIPLVKLLGGTSGKEVDKQKECEKLGFVWGQLPGSDNDDASSRENSSAPLVLPGCAYYLRLTAIGDLVDCGSHCVALCKVEEMFVSSEETKTEYISTAQLRKLGIITELGRVAE